MSDRNTFTADGMDAQAAATLLELLRRVPIDARIAYDYGPFSAQYIPVGRYCNEASDEIGRLRTELAQTRLAYENACAQRASMLAERDAYASEERKQLIYAIVAWLLQYPCDPDITERMVEELREAMKEPRT